jgi:hypothetical protein
LPGSYLEGSRAARVRIRVGDGFNQTVAVSGRFTVLSAPPQVSISKTLRSLPGDARLQLQGQAFDQRPAALAGRNLRWFDGPFALGRGTTLSAGPLPPGQNRIRLVASDSGGAGSASVVVSVSPVRLRFLQLAIPKILAASARKLILHARSAVRATLALGHRRFGLGPRQKKLSIPVKSAGPLLLHLALSAGGTRTPFSALVKRR